MASSWGTSWLGRWLNSWGLFGDVDIDGTATVRDSTAITMTDQLNATATLVDSS